jgi:NitT/TauT family transport system substrate-binding protein
MRGRLGLGTGVSRPRVFWFASWLLVLMLIAAACGGDDGANGAGGGEEEPGGAPEISDLTVMVANVPQFLPVFVAEEQGFFEEYGLTVDTPVFEGGAGRATEAAIAGEAEIGYTSWPLADSLALQGQQLKYLTWHAYYAKPEVDGQVVDAGQHDIVVLEDSPIQSVADLEGARIAALARGSNEEAILRHILDGAGVDPDSIEIVEAFWTDHPQLLESGQVDAAYMIYPFTAADIPYPETSGGGLRSLGDPFFGGEQGMVETLGPEGGSLVGPTVVTPEFMEQNPNTIRAFVFAIRDAVDWIGENEQAALDLAVERTGVEEAILVASPPNLYVKCLDQTAQMERFGQLMVNAGFQDELPDYAAYTSDLPFTDEEMCTEPNLVVWNPGEFAG